VESAGSLIKVIERGSLSTLTTSDLSGRKMRTINVDLLVDEKSCRTWFPLDQVPRLMARLLDNRAENEIVADGSHPELLDSDTGRF
jgi:hypothetical protein